LTATKAYGKETLTARLFFAIDKLWVYIAGDMHQSFSSFLRELPLIRNLSLREIAKILGTNHGTLHAAMSGKYPPPPKQLDQWAERLRLKPEDRAEMWMLALSAKAPEDIQALCHALIGLYRDTLAIQKEQETAELMANAVLPPVQGRRVADALPPDAWSGDEASAYAAELDAASPGPDRPRAARKRGGKNERA
jgi:transcriptional regulator with XRE-family HTH domain